MFIKYCVERWLSSYEHILLLQRTQVQSLEPTSDSSQPCITPVPGHVTPLASLGFWTHMHIPQRHIYTIKNKFKQIYLCVPLRRVWVLCCWQAMVGWGDWEEEGLFHPSGFRAILRAVNSQRNGKSRSFPSCIEERNGDRGRQNNLVKTQRKEVCVEGFRVRSDQSGATEHSTRH